MSTEAGTVTNDIYATFLESLDEARMKRGNPSHVCMNTRTFYALLATIAPDIHYVPVGSTKTVYGLEVVIDQSLSDNVFKMDFRA